MTRHILGPLLLWLPVTNVFAHELPANRPTLQEHAMQAVVSPGKHPHEIAVEIRAQVIAPRDIDSVAVALNHPSPRLSPAHESCA